MVRAGCEKPLDRYYPALELTLNSHHKGNVTEWGLKKYLEHEWKCTEVSDYSASLYDDTYLPPRPHQYLQRCERKARDSLVLNVSFTFV